MQSANIKTDRKTWLRKQRAKRIATEIHLLEKMDWRLWKLGLLCFWGTFFTVVLAVFASVEWLVRPVNGMEVSHLIIFLICAACVGFLYWFWHYPIWGFALLGYLVLILCLAALFDDGSFPNIGNPGWPSDSGYSASTDRKELLRWRVQRAIQKRQKLLEVLKA